MYSARKNRHSVITTCITLAISAIAFTSKTQNSSQRFTDKYWVVESVTVSPSIDLDLDGKPDTDMTILIEECEKDDALMFKSDNTLIQHVGEKKCDDDDPIEEEVGEWSYNESTKTLTQNRFDSDGKPQSALIKSVSPTKLVIHTSFTTTNNKEHLVVAVYKAK